MRADAILQHAQNPNSKYIALSILDRLITTRWKVLPVEQQQGIRNFVVKMTIEWSNDDSIFVNQKQLLNKADLTLVQILKQEWPNNWPTFIPEVVTASRTGFNVCENNMIVLRLLSEEVFDFSAEQMTQAKAKFLKKTMKDEFSQVYQLCYEVLSKADKPSLLLATLKCLQRYLSWTPVDFIFRTPIAELLVNKYLYPSEFRNEALKCLTEIAGTENEDLNQAYSQMFARAVDLINEIVPLSADLAQIYETANTNDQDFIQNLSLFFCIFLTYHLKLFENPASSELLLNVHVYLIKISKIDEREIFKGCLEYWSRLVSELYAEIQKIPLNEIDPSRGGTGGLTVGSMAPNGAIDPQVLANYSLRKHLYAGILSNLRLVMIEKMVRPEEVLVVENDEGEIVREFVKESDTIMLYKSMREVLVYLTHLDVLDTRDIMTNKLAKQVDGSEWSWNNLNTLCWAIGSISGAMNEEMEKQFLVTVIKELLGLTEKKRGKDNKAVVASNIMYIVGQYPRFLRAHWRFLKTVVNKLFEFMHETHEGVQDMACDTFIKICSKCKRHFVARQSGETEPFIDDIIRNLHQTTADLAPHQVHTFYEACGDTISAQANKTIRDRLVTDLMKLPNMAWQAKIEEIKQDTGMLASGDNAKIFVNILKTNVAVCSTLGPGFDVQLSRIYFDALGVYQAVSQQIVQDFSTGDQTYQYSHRLRVLRSIKREILKLIDLYLDKTDALEEVVNTMVGPLLNTILEDYQRCPQDTREAEVLSCAGTLTARVGGAVPDMVVRILEHVFEPTLDMIGKSMNDYPEFRVEFFKLLRTINLDSFAALLRLPPQIFKKTVDACLWASKHDNREVEGFGLSLILEIIGNMAALDNRQISDQFFKEFFKPIIGDTFFVLTDADHKSGFKIQSQILAKVIELVESNKISIPLYQEGEAPQGTNNGDYTREYLHKSLMAAFPHLQPLQVTNFVKSLFLLHKDPIKFRLALRDFLVQIKEFGGEATDYLYAEERELEVAEKQKEERQRAMKVGGLLKPSEMED